MAVTFGVEIAEARRQQTRGDVTSVLQCRKSKVPLIAAVANGDVGQVAALLACGANPNDVGVAVGVDDWVDAVGVAVMTKRVDVLLLLVKAGAKPHGAGGGTEDPVFLAALGGSADVLNVLLAAPGASVSSPRAQYVFAAAQFGHADALANHAMDTRSSGAVAAAPAAAAAAPAPAAEAAAAPPPAAPPAPDAAAAATDDDVDDEEWAKVEDFIPTRWAWLRCEAQARADELEDYITEVESCVEINQ